MSSVSPRKDNRKKDWVPDSEVTHCAQCQAPFTLTRRKHHCRKCNNIFCKKCSTICRLTTGNCVQYFKISVCDECYAALMRGEAQSPKSENLSKQSSMRSKADHNDHRSALLRGKPWFYDESSGVDRQKAEKMLLESKLKNVFLVRIGQDEDAFVLSSLTADRNVVHTKLRLEKNSSGTEEIIVSINGRQRAFANVEMLAAELDLVGLERTRSIGASLFEDSDDESDEAAAGDASTEEETATSTVTSEPRADASSNAVSADNATRTSTSTESASEAAKVAAALLGAQAPLATSSTDDVKEAETNESAIVATVATVENNATTTSTEEEVVSKAAAVGGVEEVAEKKDLKPPVCGDGHVCKLSDFAAGDYFGGWNCDQCSKSGVGFRWYCDICFSDYCRTCYPTEDSHRWFVEQSIVEMIRSAECSDAEAIQCIERRATRLIGTDDRKDVCRLDEIVPSYLEHASAFMAGALDTAEEMDKYAWKTSLLHAVGMFRSHQIQKRSASAMIAPLLNDEVPTQISGLPILKALLEVFGDDESLDWHVEDSQEHYTPLMYACHGGDLDLAKFIVDKGDTAQIKWPRVLRAATMGAGHTSDAPQVLTWLLDTMKVDVNAPLDDDDDIGAGILAATSPEATFDVRNCMELAAAAHWTPVFAFFDERGGTCSAEARAHIEGGGAPVYVPLMYEVFVVLLADHEKYNKTLHAWLEIGMPSPDAFFRLLQDTRQALLELVDKSHRPSLQCARGLLLFLKQVLDAAGGDSWYANQQLWFLVSEVFGYTRSVAFADPISLMPLVVRTNSFMDIPEQFLDSSVKKRIDSDLESRVELTRADVLKQIDSHWADKASLYDNIHDLKKSLKVTLHRIDWANITDRSAQLMINAILGFGEQAAQKAHAQLCLGYLRHFIHFERDGGFIDTIFSQKPLLTLRYYVQPKVQEMLNFRAQQFMN